MSIYYVTGGRQRPNAKGHIEWFSYGKASIFSFDDRNGSIAECATYSTPIEIRPEDPKANIVFKAGSIAKGNLVVCTQTEILTYSLPDFRQIGYASHPWLNDVHHVKVNGDGNFLVANTGLDLVLELTPAGKLVKEWSTLVDENPWDRFDREKDYRRVVTTKPHHSHPNYVFEHGDDLWVSRFVQRDAFCLTNPSKRINIGLEKIHDGVVVGDQVTFTTVDGHVAVADLLSCKVLRVYDLNKITGNDKTLGWCRGLHILDEDRVLVGFSRLRPSKFRENVRWVKFKAGMRKDAGKLPTRVVCFNLEKQTIEGEFNLEKEGCNAVFSILKSE
ncbi:MAG: hypothetical protein KOO60_03805 [Gemmatimonadales bacterium]|nr:hypothetical protein [Gemmatimonadales bacterium]